MKKIKIIDAMGIPAGEYDLYESLDECTCTDFDLCGINVAFKSGIIGAVVIHNDHFICVNSNEKYEILD